jgi:hypothetical protein
MLQCSVGFRPSQLGGRVRPLSSPVWRTIFWSVTTRGLPEIAEPIVDLVSRGVSVAGIAAREGVPAKRNSPEMAAQQLEKIESAPGNGMVSEASNPQDVVHGRADRARLRLTSRKNDKVAEKGA